MTVLTAGYIASGRVRSKTKMLGIHGYTIVNADGTVNAIDMALLKSYVLENFQVFSDV